MKTCTKCNVEKPFTEFYKDTRPVSGLSYTCKVCSNNASVDWYKKSKDTEAYKARRDAYNAYRKSEEYKAQRRATRDLVKNREECKKYAASNKEKIATRHKADRQARPDVYKERRRNNYHKSGKQRGLEGIKNLTDNYVKNVLVIRSKGLTYADIPQALVEAKRLQLLIKREVRDADQRP